MDKLVKCQGKPVDLGGYYKDDKAKVDEDEPQSSDGAMWLRIS